MEGSFMKKFVVLVVSCLMLQFPLAFAISLPHSIFYGEKEAIDTESSIVPAYLSQINYTEDDLRKEIELEYSYNLDEFIALLNNDPVEIFWYILNNFDYEPYYGSLKGPEGTFLQRGGNDLDLANLLVEIYRQLGIPARYVRGNIMVSEDQMRKWLGIDDVERVLKTGLIPYEKTSGGYIVEHFWVEAYLDGKWVPLDPSFKEYEYVPPELELRELGENFTKSVVNSSIEGRGWSLLKKSVEASPALSDETMGNLSQLIVKELGVKYIGNTSNQSIYRTLKGLSQFKKAVFGTWKIVKSRGEFGKLPFQVSNVLEEFSRIPSKFRYKVRIGLEGHDINSTLLLANVSTKRITLSWLPATEGDMSGLRRYDDITQVPVNSVNVTPVLILDGVPVAVGKISHLGEKANLTVTMLIGDRVLYSENTVTTIGGYYAVSIDSLRVSEQFLNYRLNRLRITSFMLEKGFSNITRDEILGEMLNLAGLTYWYKLDGYAEEVAASLGMRWLRVPSVIVLGTAYRVENDRLKFLGMFVDVQKDLYLPLSQNGNKSREKAFMMLTGQKGSELEAQVLREYFDAPAISTATIFEMAYQMDIPIYHINSSNVNSLLPALNISDDDKDKILHYVNQGLEVYVPGRNININGWNGTGYYVIDPETGAMAYMISGGIRGGLSFVEWIQSLMQDAAMNLFEKLGFIARLGEKTAEKVSGVVSVFVSAVLATVEAVASCLEVHPCECGQLIKQKIVSVAVDGAMVTLTISIGLSAFTGGLSFGLALAATTGLSLASYIIGDITKTLINWFLGFRNALRNCPAPDVVIRQPKTLIKVSNQVMDYVTAFHVCVVSRNGLNAYRRVHWEIPYSGQVPLIRYGVRGIRTREGTIYASSRYQCDSVYVMIDPQYVPMDVKLKGGIVEVPVKVSVEMETFKGLKTFTKTGYIRYRYVVKKHDLIQILGLSKDITYTEGGSGETVFTFINRGDRPARIFVRKEGIPGLRVEHPKTVPPRSQFTVKVTSSGLPKGKYSGTITVIGEFDTDTGGYREDSAIGLLWVTVKGRDGKPPGRGDGGRDAENPRSDHPDDNSDVPMLTLTKENSFYSLLREGAKKNITEAAELLDLASYHSMLYQLTASNISEYRELAAGIAKLYIKLSSNLKFLDDLVEKAPDVALFRRGFYDGAENLLRSAMIPYRLVDESFDPVRLARYQKILILPSGSLFGMNTPFFRKKLELYLENGGSIIVFDQQYGSHFSVIPGGLGGYGWAQDQMCHRNALYAAQDHPILSTVISNTITEDVDGYFESYPPNSVVLMRRTKNDFPAMLIYRYGKGYVLATTLYSDWKSQRQVSGFMLGILRDAILYIELRGDVYEIGMQRVWYGLRFSHSYYVIPVNVTNPTNSTVDGMKFRVLTPSGEISSEIEVNESLRPGEKRVIYLNLSSSSFKSTALGIWTLDYVLLSGGREVYTKYDAKGISLNIYYGNDAYFNYKGGSKYLMWATAEKETALFGEKITLTLHIINKDSKPLTGQLGIGHHIWGWNVLDVRNVSVAPGEYKKYSFEVYPYVDVHGYEGLRYYFGLYTSGSPYNSATNFADAALVAEKGIYVKYPNLELVSDIEKNEYAPGELIHVRANITNSDDIDWNLRLVTLIRYMDNVVKASSQPITIPRYSKISIPVSIELPKDAKPGYYQLVTMIGDIYGKVTEHDKVPSYYLWFRRASSNVEFSSEFTKPLGVSIRARITNGIPLIEPRLYTFIYYIWKGGHRDERHSFNLTFTNNESEVQIPLNEDIFGRYEVSYILYDGKVSVASGSTYFNREVQIKADIKSPVVVFGNLSLLVHLHNPGFLEENFNLNVTIPVLNYTSITPMSLAPNGNRTVNITLPVPPIKPGRYIVIIRAQKAKGVITKRIYFRIPESSIVGIIESGPYSAGENVTAMLRNRGGVPARVRGNLSILQHDSVISNSSFEFTLNPGEEKTVRVEIPENITPGGIIVLNFTDITGNKSRSIMEPLQLIGLRIQAIHGNESYALDNITVTLVNTGGIKDTVNVTISLRRSIWGGIFGQQSYHDITLSPGESVNVTFRVPNVASGRYVFYVLARGKLSSSSYWDYLDVIGTNISMAVEKTSYTAGDNVTLRITNSGGGYANLTLSARLTRGRTSWSIGRTSVGIGKLESKEVNFTLPKSLPTGNYTLVITHDFGIYTRNITVRGLELEVTLLKDRYDVDEDIQVGINNTGGTDADLSIDYQLSGYRGEVNVTLPSGAYRTISIDIPDNLPSGSYDLHLSIYDRFTGLSVSKSFSISVRGAELVMTPLKTDLAPGEGIPVRFENTGGIDLNLNVTLRVAGTSASTQLSIPKGGNTSYTFALPPLAKGEYDADLTAVDGNSGRSFWRSFGISISGFRINATVNGNSFAIGDTVMITLTSGTDADAHLSYRLDMVDEADNSFHLKNGTLTLPARGTATITATIGKVARGNYTLILRMTEINTGEKFVITRVIYIDGAWGQLEIGIPGSAFLGKVPVVVNLTGNTNGTLKIVGNVSIDSYPTKIVGIESDGGLWIVFSTHLGYYHDGNLELFAYPSGISVESYEGGPAAVTSSNSRIWISSFDKILEFDKATHRWKVYKTTEIPGFPAYYNWGWGEEPVNIFALAYYNNSLWAGTDNSGLVRIDPETMTTMAVYNSTNSPLTADYIMMLKVNGSDLWAVGNGVWRIGNSWTYYPPESFNMSWVDAVEVFDNQVWIGGGNDSGTFVCMVGGVCLKNLPSWRISNIEHDNESLWIIYPPWGEITASRYYFANRTLVNYPRSSFWGNLVEIEDGVYASSYGIIMDGKMLTFGPRGYVKDIAYHNGTVYMLTEMGAVVIYHLKDSRWEYITDDAFVGGNRIARAGGRLFITTWSNLVEYELDSGRVVVYNSSNSPFNSFRNPISLAGSDDMLYVGTNDGLVVLNLTSGNFVTYYPPDFGGTSVRDVWLNGNELWIAGDGGAGIYDPASNVYQPYLSGKSSWLVRAYDDEVWAAFSQGSDYSLWHYNRLTGTSEIYNSTNGLTGSYINDIARFDGLIFVTYSWASNMSIFDGYEWKTVSLPVSSVESSESGALLGGGIFAIYSMDIFEFPVDIGRNEFNITVRRPGYNEYTFRLLLGKQVLDEKTAGLMAYRHAISFGLTTPKHLYKKGETATFEVTIRNDAPLEDVVSYKLVLAGSTYEDTLVIGPTREIHMTFAVKAEESFNATLTVNGESVVVPVSVVEPRGEIVLSAPDVVGYNEPFNATLTVTNTGVVPIELSIQFAGNRSVSIDPGDSVVITKEMRVTDDTTVRAIISGDLNRTLEKRVLMGERVRLVFGNYTVAPGYSEIPFTVENSGILDSNFTLTVRTGNWSWRTDVSIPAGTELNLTMPVNLSEGSYTFVYESRLGGGSFHVEVVGEKLSVAYEFDGKTLTLNVTNLAPLDFFGTLRVDSAIISNRTNISVAANSWQLITFPVSEPSPGTYNITVWIERNGRTVLEKLISIRAKPNILMEISGINSQQKIGDALNVSVEVRNRGTAREEDLLIFEIPGIYRKEVPAEIGVGERKVFNFTLTLPEDLPSRTLRARAELGNATVERSFFVRGVNVSVALTTDRLWYYDDGNITATITLTNHENVTLKGNVSLSCGGFSETKSFELGKGRENLSFTFPACSRIFYQVSLSTGRIIYINSRLIQIRERNAVVTLITDKERYLVGDNMTVHIYTTRPVSVSLIVFNNVTLVNVTDNVSLKFRIPDVESGTYRIYYSYGNETMSKEFDVVSPSAKILDFELRKKLFEPGENVSFSAIVHTEEDVIGKVMVWLYRGTSLIDYYYEPLNLTAGDNYVNITTDITVPNIGTYTLVYAFYRGLNSTMIASGSQSLQTEGALIASMATDKESYTEAEDIKLNLVITGTPGTYTLKISGISEVLERNVTVDGSAGVNLTLPAKYFDTKITAELFMGEYSTSKEVAVEVTNLPPVANFKVKGNMSVNSELTFDASWSTDPGDDSLTYSWDFGDGTVLTASTPVVKHAYTQAGNYTVILTVSDGEGGIDVATLVLEISEAGVTKNVTTVTREGAFRKLLIVARIWTARYFYYRGEFDDLVARAKELEASNETLESIIKLHQEAEELMVMGWHAGNLEEVLSIWMRGNIIPDIIRIRRAYLLEKEAVRRLRKLLGL